MKDSAQSLIKPETEVHADTASLCMDDPFGIGQKGFFVVYRQKGVKAT
jgi:hypothetical protein